ncbi:hypothetical protein [Streptomyces sp. cg40]|uniref:hypothetical protein n=1 Tax=Streptomyces sp. cg40 TaxID=3419764 RepID=UPI003D07A58B
MRGCTFAFASFFFGAAVPLSGTSRFRADPRQRVGLVDNVLLLPVLFLVAGVQVDLSGARLVAVGGKLLGAYAATS